jgi:hypothetical protein
MSTSSVATTALILSFKSLMSATRVRYTQSFTYPHRKKSQGVISGDLAGQEMGPARPIYQFGKCWLKDTRTIKLQCFSAPSSWKNTAGCSYYYYYYYYYLFTAIGFAPGGSGPYTTQLQQKNIQ